MSRHFDAVVIGGGPAGSVAALCLVRVGWSVLLVERKTFPRRKVCGEFLSATNLPLLHQLGVAAAFQDLAGPEVRRVGLYHDESVLTGDLPRCAGTGGWGRALGREQLDHLLLQQARGHGVEVCQPGAVIRLVREGATWHGRVEGRTAEIGAAALDTEGFDFATRVVIAAHGSWEPGPLPSQKARPTGRPSDLFGFKAHFRGCQLPMDLMPLLAFPGGYGGMVHTDDGRVSLSCCVRRDRLHQLRAGSGASAGTAVGAFIQERCRGVREALAQARREGPWLAAGPIRPGCRLQQLPGLFPVGNAAGEAHPVIAEGISMAMQSGWLAAACLQRWRELGGRAGGLPAVATSYARAWRRAFVPRQWAASVVAHWAMSPLVSGSLPLLRRFPKVLTWGARASGKVRRVVACVP